MKAVEKKYEPAAVRPLNPDEFIGAMLYYCSLYRLRPDTRDDVVIIAWLQLKKYPFPAGKTVREQITMSRNLFLLALRELRMETTTLVTGSDTVCGRPRKYARKHISVKFKHPDSNRDKDGNLYNGWNWYKKTEDPEPSYKIAETIELFQRSNTRESLAEIFLHMLAGCSKKEIAELRGIKERCVDTYMSDIRRIIEQAQKEPPKNAGLRLLDEKRLPKRLQRILKLYRLE